MMEPVKQPVSGEQAASTIRQYIVEKILYDKPGIELTHHLPLLEQGLLDSLQIFNLIVFLQEHFSIMIRPAELIPENFGSIQALVALVNRHQ